MKRTFLVCAFAAAGITPLAAPGQTPAYPTKPVRFIAPFPPGGTSDIIARVAAQKLTGALGKQVQVDNRGGASGTIGYELAAKAPPDGYTLLLCSMGGLVTNQFLFKRLPFDPQKDFAPISQLATAGQVLVVPMMAEAGVKEWFPQTWWAMAAPRGVSPAIITRLNTEIATAMKSADVQERFASLGLVPLHSTPERVTELVKIGSAQMGKVVKAAGIQPE